MESNIDSLERPRQNSTCTWRRASIENIAQEPENSAASATGQKMVVGCFGMIPGFDTRNCTF